MGPKNNKKVKNARPTLSNPFMENVYQPGAEQIEKLLELLANKLLNIYPPQVNNKQVMSSLEQEFKNQNEESNQKSEPNLCSNLNKKEKLQLFRNKRKELRYANHSTLNVKLREDITIGLKKCLKELSLNNICVLIFDSTVNLEPMRCIFEKGLHNLNIIGIPNLSDSVKKSLGFPTICIGFKNVVKDEVNDVKHTNHFYPIVELVRSFVKSHKVSKSICDIVRKEKVEDKNPDKNNKPTNDTIPEKHIVEKTVKASYDKDDELPKIEILYRKDSNTRVFIPTSNQNNCKSKKDMNCDFISFSEEPQLKKQKLL